MWTAARMRLDKWTCRPPAARKLKIDSVDRKIDAAQPPPKQSLFSAGAGRVDTIFRPTEVLSI